MTGAAAKRSGLGRVAPIPTWRWIALSLAIVAGCGGVTPRPSSGDADPASAAAALGLRLPATFRGDLPCADCEGIRHHLDLWPDQVFHLRREWRGRDLVRDDIGRWRTDPARQTLMLRSGGEMALQFEIKSPDRLRLLDTRGAPIVSTLPYDLAGAPLAPTELRLALAGEMTYLADATRFTECLTGRSYPVAPEGDVVAMQRAYLALAEAPGARLYVSFDGTIAERARMEGAGSERSVVVDRFGAAAPGRRCE